MHNHRFADPPFQAASDFYYKESTHCLKVYLYILLQPVCAFLTSVSELLCIHHPTGNKDNFHMNWL